MTRPLQLYLIGTDSTLAKAFTLAKSRQDLRELNRFLVHFALSNNHSVVTMVNRSAKKYAKIIILLCEFGLDW